jgi:lauroyl/myristoyl acyltransferase
MPAASPSDENARAIRRPLISAKDLVWLIYLYPARWLAAVLPLRVLYFFGDILARLTPRLLRTTRRRLIARLRLAFPEDTGSAHVDEIANGYFRNATLRFLDDLLLVRLAREQRLRNVEVVNLENLTGALSIGKGAVMVSGHFFATRPAKRYLASLGYPSLSLRILDPGDPHAGRLGKRFLQPRYVELLSQIIRTELSTRDPDRSLKMLARLRAGGLMDILFEGIEPNSSHQVRREFLGYEEDFAAGYFHLAWIARAPMVPMFCTGTSRNLRIEFGEPIRPENWPDRARFAEEGLNRILGTLAEYIRQAPEQWDLWIRW